MILFNLFIYSIIVPALFPVAIILWYVYKKDILDKEPKSLLFKVFILGMVACLPVCIVEIIMEKILSSVYTAGTNEFIWAENLYGVALIEELGKMIVFMTVIWNNRNFDYYYDGIVYAVTISLGFAGLENIFYVLNYGHSVVILRALLSVPGHAIFALFMGFFLARAKACQLKGNNFGKVFLILFAIGLPTLLHGIYDYLCTVGSEMPFAFWIYIIILDFVAWHTLKHCFKTDAPFVPHSNSDDFDDIYKI